MDIINGHEKLGSRYVGHIHHQLHTNFLTNFIPWTGHDLRQIHDLENYMTSARVMPFDKVITLAEYKAFALCLAKIRALAMSRP